MTNRPIEAKKDGLAQLQDGCWKLTLKVHLDDMPTWLMSAPMGTRLACAIVEIGDDEKPVPHEKSEAKISKQQEIYAAKTEGEKAVTRAVLLCGDPIFLDWIRNLGVKVSPRRFILDECEIESRADLARHSTDSWMFKRFLKIEQQYREATGQAAECRS